MTIEVFTLQPDIDVGNVWMEYEAHYEIDPNGEFEFFEVLNACFVIGDKKGEPLNSFLTEKLTEYLEKETKEIIMCSKDY